MIIFQQFLLYNIQHKIPTTTTTSHTNRQPIKAANRKTTKNKSFVSGAYSLRYDIRYSLRCFENYILSNSLTPHNSLDTARDVPLLCPCPINQYIIQKKAKLDFAKTFCKINLKHKVYFRDEQCVKVFRR